MNPDAPPYKVIYARWYTQYHLYTSRVHFCIIRWFVIYCMIWRFLLDRNIVYSLLLQCHSSGWHFNAWIVFRNVSFRSILLQIYCISNFSKLSINVDRLSLALEESAVISRSCFSDFIEEIYNKSKAITLIRTYIHSFECYWRIFSYSSQFKI